MNYCYKSLDQTEQTSEKQMCPEPELVIGLSEYPNSNIMPGIKAMNCDLKLILRELVVHWIIKLSAKAIPQAK